MTRLWLARHGETAWSATGRHTSVTDLDLTDAGVEAARLLGHRLSGRRFGLVLVSPRLRARRTAELAGFADAEVDPDLAEWDYGDYEGLTTEQIRARDTGWTVFTGTCPNGETAETIGRRVDRALVRVADAGVQEALLVGHGHCLRVLAARWLGRPPSFGAHLELGVATLSVLDHQHDAPTLASWNS